jgi:hypothetical protein
MRTKAENARGSDGVENSERPAAAAKNKKLAPAALRALREAEERRADIDREAANRPKELPARQGPDPVRYGDWEKKGIASDF